MTSGLRIRSKIGSWGGSPALRLPKAATEALKLRSGEAVELTIEGDALLVRRQQPAYSLDDMVAVARKLQAPESTDDGSVGNELL